MELFREDGCLSDEGLHALTAGQLEITVQNLHIAVQLGDVGHFALCQRAFAVGQQPVFKLHHRLPVQAVTVAVAVVVILVLLGVAQQGQMVPEGPLREGQGLVLHRYTPFSTYFDYIL